MKKSDSFGDKPNLVIGTLIANEHSVCRRLTVAPGMCGHNSLFVGQVGDWTWDAVGRICGVDPFNARNEQGHPSYLSFFYYHIMGTHERHLKMLRIGDQVEVTTSLFRVNSESLLAVHEVRPVGEGPLEAQAVDLEKMFENPDPQRIYLITYNRWVSRSGEGNEQLVKTSPPDFRFQHLPKVPSQYAPWKYYRPAIASYSFHETSDGYETLIPLEGLSRIHGIDPVRDINGVGLLYFAAYFDIVDQACVHLWRQLGGSTQAFLDRAVLDQKICYLGNADYDTPLDLKLGLRRSRTARHYLFDISIYRQTDHKLIAVCSQLLGLDQDVRLPKGGRQGVHHRKTEEVAGRVAAILGTLLDRPNSVGHDDDFSDYGLDSVSVVEFIDVLNETFGLDNYPQLALEPTTFFAHRNIRNLATYLAVHLYPGDVASVEVAPRLKLEPALAHEPIAVVGMAGVFPGASNYEVFWQNLMAGTDQIGEVPKDRWDWQLWQEHEPEAQMRWGGFLPDVAGFDHRFFKISPKEAAYMDPQQRLLLEVTYTALEDACIPPRALNGEPVGLYVGVSNNDYFQMIVDEHLPVEAHFPTGNSHAVLANRISYQLNLKGPSQAVDTACSSSLVAVHHAVRALREGVCSAALAGGVNLMLHPLLTVAYSKAGMLSPDGRCKTFDSRANGYVRGEGAGMLVLKPLHRALDDGNLIHGLIRGSAQNHGGHANSLTAPNPNAHADLLRAAWEDADIHGRTLTYLEAHGTGTPLGDPIEINGIKQALAQASQQTDAPAGVPSCYVGSVKTAVGHLEAAAGMAGIVKALLAMKYRQLPANLHLVQVNSYIHLEGTALRILDRQQAWEPYPLADGGTLSRRAGVSSFGFGGANAHVVLEEYVPPLPPKPTGKPRIVVLSAQSTDILRNYAGRMLAWLGQTKTEEDRITGIAFSLSQGRQHHPYRLALVVVNEQQLADGFQTFLEGRPGRNLAQGVADQKQPLMTTLLDGKPGERFVQTLLEEGQPERLALLWTMGLSIDWLQLFEPDERQRLALPTYPFARDRHWLPGIPTPANAASEKRVVAPGVEKFAAASTSAPASVGRSEDGEIVSWLTQLFTHELALSSDELAPDRNLHDMGLDSFLINGINDALEGRFGSLSKTLLYEYETIQALGDYLITHHEVGDIATKPVDGPAVIQERITQPEPFGHDQGIAIIGLSGRYPQAPNVAQFAQNIFEGRDCITSMPEERPWQDGTRPLGGFLDGIGMFDPLSFQISPRDAVVMTPQERIFLENARTCFEDAGYARESLEGRRVGVFAGSMWSQYQLMGLDQDGSVPWGQTASVANRVSYYYNLHGPSLSLDTMCSSALSAIHLARESLLRGETEMALAGGVNLSLHPQKYSFLQRNHFTSSDGRCRSFGAGGDGYVPAEGVGAVLLKTLTRAQADGDHIYAVIKGSALNHGGKTSGYTVPNPRAQADVVAEAHRSAGVTGRALQYVEAHGTGTDLGDPIEIAGLTRAFGEAGGTSWCALGSVKSNIGHGEAVAAIAGLTKVILQMQAQRLAPSLHAREINPKIQFDQTPFYLQGEEGPWPAPKSGLRCAGLSSFGAGGANGHLVLEEYVASHVPRPLQPVLVVLSARTEASLGLMVEDLATFLRSHTPDLTDLAYTLQVGREAEAVRLAMVCASLDELRQMLQSFPEIGTGMFEGKAAKAEAPSGMGDLASLAAQWVRGAKVDWSALYEVRPRRISLPTYRFDRQYYWIESVGGVRTSSVSASADNTQLLPSAPFLHDHKVAGKALLPGAALVQMALSACKRQGREVNALSKFHWFAPVDLGATPLPGLQTREEGARLALVLDSADEPTTFATVSLGAAGAPPTVDPCPTLDCAQEWDGATCYAAFHGAGLQYGPAFQPITQLCWQGTEAVGQLQLPASLEGHGFNVHPTLLDGAFQCALGLLQEGLAQGFTYVPVALGRIDLFGPLTDKCTVCVRTQAGAAVDLRNPPLLDLTLYDAQQKPVLVAQGLRLRRLIEAPKSEIIHYYKPVSVPAPYQQTAQDQPFLVWGSDDTLRDLLGERALHVQPGTSFAQTERGYRIDPRAADQLKQLFAHLDQQMPACARLLLPLEGSFGDTDGVSLLPLLQFLAKNKKCPVRIVLWTHAERLRPEHRALAGMAETLERECRHLSMSLLHTPGEVASLAPMRELAESVTDRMVTVCGNQRQVVRLIAQEPANQLTPFQQGATFLITGGMGGLGLIFARFLVRKFRADLVLCGRSKCGERQEKLLAELEQAGTRVSYHQVDICDQHQLQDLRVALQEQGRLPRGIIHAAGITRDGLLAQKALADFKAVVQPKIKGTQALDQVFAQDPLDFLLLCSSITAVMGNPGQIDYAYGNSYMDAFAHQRNHLRELGQRQGTCVSLNWPLWQDGGMQVSESVARRLFQQTGMQPMTTAAGLEALQAVLADGGAQWVAVQGDGHKLATRLSVWQGDAEALAGAEVDAASPPSATSVQQLTTRVAEICGKALRLDLELLETDTDLDAYGMDSIAMMDIVAALEETFDVVCQPSHLVDLPNVDALVGWLVPRVGVEIESPPSTVQTIPAGGLAHEIREICAQLLLIDAADLDLDEPFVDFGMDLVHLSEVLERLNRMEDEHQLREAITINDLARRLEQNGVAPEEIPVRETETSVRDVETNRIAVIGMACRFPQSPDVDSFWQNILKGVDLISQSPPARLDFSGRFSSDRDMPDTAYTTCGAYLDDVAQFDAAFFKVSPVDAIVMDPQQRILLELSAELFAHAGYQPKAFEGTRTGVYLGAGDAYYSRIHADHIPVDASKHMVVGNIPNMIAARLADTYNFTGNAQTVDTACSSSLVALHQACRDLRSGESKCAIAGGVQLLLDPYYHVGFSKARVLAPDGRCRVFDRGARGFVLGEGAGLVLLKPLRDAQADGDRILAVVAGSAVNNDGKTVGLTTPNQQAQTQVIRAALDDAAVPARSISLLEAHGTGTLLGDPIEVKAAATAFASETVDTGFCAIGSIKSNMGHLLRAAGIAGFIKLVCALHHQQKPPTLHCPEPHPRFRFSETPFVPIARAQPWTKQEAPRRAAISSFGFGGTNCHMILEEAGEQQGQRIPLPPPRFQRQRFWLAPEPQTDEDQMYAQLLQSLSEGTLSPEQGLLQLQEMGHGG